MKHQMAGKEISLTEQAVAKLKTFEEHLNPAQPESGPFAPRIIGYGEMSTVFSFDDSDFCASVLHILCGSSGFSF
jgi:hypothetical protein